MNQNLYNEIITTISQHFTYSRECKLKLEKSFPDVHPATLASIVSLEYQKRMKYSNYKNSDLYEELYSTYVELKKETAGPGVLLNLALEWGVAPAIVARLALRQYFESLGEENENAMKSTKRNISSMLKDTTLIEDKDFAYEIFMVLLSFVLCTAVDDQYSPTADTIKHTVGQQYEIRLHRYLEKEGIAYRDEANLRKIGYDKTPDVKLEIPVAVNGFVINWIESKALFGDEEAHRNYMKDQYLGYWNRFGPGLVIYWFGYLETIKDNNDKRFIVMEDVPKAFTSFNHSEEIAPES